MMPPNRSFNGRWLGVLLLAALAVGNARGQAASEEGTQPLPDPLTLEHALSLADESQPDIVRARADRAYQQAELIGARALTGVKVSLEARARWVEPSDLAPDQSRDDHQGSLFVRKNLYDFGRSAAREDAARAGEQASRFRYLSAIQQQRLLIMERFFDVVLADMAFARDNEDLATAYVSLDRLRNRQELGQVSDIELLEAESDYQEVRRRRAESEARQRLTRARLAIALDRPGALPSNVAEPDLSQLERELPDHEVLLQRALADNPAIRARRAEVEAAQERLLAARAGGRPYLDAELEAAEYSREMGSHDEWRAGVNFIVPLYTSGAVDAEVGRARAELNRAQATLTEVERQVRESVLELWLDLQTLRVERDRVRALQDYRDLYLDRSRAVYEMELKTDLGDAMVRLSEAQLAEAQNRFRRALAWERLDALVGAQPAGGT